MLKLFALLLLLVVAVVALIFWVLNQIASSKNVEPIDPQKARILSDEFLDDYINNRREAMYAKILKSTQRHFSREQMDSLMNYCSEQFGKVVEFEFVSDVSGVLIPSKIPKRDIKYKLTTDKGKTYSFTIEVVPNESELAVKTFEIPFATLTIWVEETLQQLNFLKSAIYLDSKKYGKQYDEAIKLFLHLIWQKCEENLQKEGEVSALLTR